MTTIIEPASVAADANVKIKFVHVMGDPAHPGIHEVNAGSAVDVSCYLTDTGWKPAINEQTITDNRLCSRKIFERRGRAQDSLDIEYVYNIESAADDEAHLALLTGVTGFFVARYGSDFEIAFVTGDLVDVVPVELGVQFKMAPVGNAVLMIAQKCFVVAPGVQRDVIITGS